MKIYVLIIVVLACLATDEPGGGTITINTVTPDLTDGRQYMDGGV